MSVRYVLNEGILEGVQIVECEALKARSKNEDDWEGRTMQER